MQSFMKIGHEINLCVDFELLTEPGWADCFSSVSADQHWLQCGFCDDLSRLDECCCSPEEFFLKNQDFL